MYTYICLYNISIYLSIYQRNLFILQDVYRCCEIVDTCLPVYYQLTYLLIYFLYISIHLSGCLSLQWNRWYLFARLLSINLFIFYIILSIYQDVYRCCEIVDTCLSVYYQFTYLLIYFLYISIYLSGCISLLWNCWYLWDREDLQCYENQD